MWRAQEQWYEVHREFNSSAGVQAQNILMVKFGEKPCCFEILVFHILGHSVHSWPSWSYLWVMTKRFGEVVEKGYWYIITELENYFALPT